MDVVGLPTSLSLKSPQCQLKATDQFLLIVFTLQFIGIQRHFTNEEMLQQSCGITHLLNAFVNKSEHALSFAFLIEHPLSHLLDERY